MIRYMESSVLCRALVRLISFFANIAKILNRDGEMAVYMKSIPTLRGQVGSRFIAMFEDNFLRRVFNDSILEGRFLLFACHLFIFAIVEPIKSYEICLN